MRSKMLLTPSQVSVAISSTIIVLCTAALFFSGYAIQQRTLRQLRIAIRPDSRPKIYLPDRFKATTTELEDGSVVELRETTRAPNQKPKGQRTQKKQKGTVVEIRPTVPEDVKQKPIAPKKQATKKKKGKAAEEKEKEELPVSRAERRRRIKQDIQELSQGETPVYYQRRLW